MTTSSQQHLNEYLYHEFGLDVEKPNREPDSSWPFKLKRLGSIETEAGSYNVFTFDAGELHYALDGPVTQFFPVSGMSLEDVRLQLLGESWLGRQRPVGIDTSVIGDDTVPPLQERLRATQGLADLVSGDVTIGLFLKSCAEYVVLARRVPDRTVFVVGSSITATEARCPDAPDYRRLTASLGDLLVRGVMR
jgi:hypothetical protein